MAEVAQTAIVPTHDHKKTGPALRILVFAATQIAVVALVFVAGVVLADEARALLSAAPAPIARIASYGEVRAEDFNGTTRRLVVAAIAVAALAGVASMWRSASTVMRVHRGIADVLAGDYTKRVPVRGGAFERDVCRDFNLMIKTFRKKFAIQKYVSESTNKMIEDLRTGEYTKDAMRRDITIFFSDVRGFTSYAERHDPMNVVDTLNTLFDIQVDAVVRFAGDIDKFIGDEVMATFANPGDAFKAAMEIQKKVATFNKHRKKPLFVGIGVHSGEAVIGALGSGDFYNWTAIGNTVNIGRRLCSAAAKGEVLVSEQAFAGIRTTRPHDTRAITAKGISTPLSVHSFTL